MDARRPDDEAVVDEPLDVTETVAPAQKRSDETGGARRWITVDDVALLLAPGQHHGATPLAARLAMHVDARDEHGWTLIMHAALRGLPVAVAELLEASADVGCQSTLLKRCESCGKIWEFPRGSTALSIANTCVEDDTSDDSDSFLVVSMLRGPGRRAGATAADLSTRGVKSGEADSEETFGSNTPCTWNPREDPSPLISACSWLPASALPAHYHCTVLQPSESAEEAARREYREAVAESAVLRASGDFSGAVDGYMTAAHRFAGTPLRDDQYSAPEPQTTASAGSFAIKRQSWDVANQQRTIEWRMS